jgi:hypothetical protein
MRGFFTRTVLPSAATVAMFALASAAGYALNPQPLPPRIAWSSTSSRVSLNPQPLPPRQFSTAAY